MVKVDPEMLLKEFVKSRSEEAFARVVAEHSGLVMATGLRKLGSRAEAEEVMQEVFVLLAKKAGALVKGEIVVGAWLYRQTCRLAANRVRGEVRRKRREEEFAGIGKTENVNGRMIMEEIDEALAKLTEKERELVICRYVEERDYAEMGSRFGVSGEAVRKKVGRAVEKLRIILAERGVSVSASALAVALVGLSGPRVSAAVVASVSGAALKESVVAGSGMFSFLGILVGAMGGSAVMGGVRMMEEKGREETPVVASGRAIAGDKSPLARIRAARATGRSPGDEDIWEHLVELDGKPKTMVTDLLLADVLEWVSADRVFDFIDTADEKISLKMKERLTYLLVGKAAMVSPRQTVEGVLERGLFKMRDPGPNDHGRLGTMAFMKWSEISFDEASSWLMDHWDELDGLGHKGSFFMMEVARRRKGGPHQRDNTDTVADHLGQLLGRKVFAVQGFEGVERLVEGFDDQSKAAAWKYVFLFSGQSREVGLYPEDKARYLATFSDHEPYGELKEVSWLRWYQLERLRSSHGGSKMTMEDYMALLPPDLAADFKKSCLDELPKDGEGGEE